MGIPDPDQGSRVSRSLHQLTQPLFPEPNIESPLNTHAAELWKNQVGECLKQNPPAPSLVGWAAAQSPVPVWPHSCPGHCLGTLSTKFPSFSLLSLQEACAGDVQQADQEPGDLTVTSPPTYPLPPGHPPPSVS